MQNNEKQVIRTGQSELTREMNQMYGRGIAAVYRDHLPYISQCYSVVPLDDEVSQTESVASFDITKLVLDREESLLEKLKNVYSLIAYSGSSISLIITRRRSGCKISLSVGTREKDSEALHDLAESMRHALAGNFPGSECSGVSYYSDTESAPFLPLNEDARFNGVNFSSIGIVTNVATDYVDDFATQGIEKLIDGIQLKEDEEYSLVLLGESVSPSEVESRKNELFRIYTALSPYRKIQKSWGQQESVTWTKGTATSISGGAGVGPAMVYAGQSFNFSKADTSGTNSSDSVEIVEYGVSHMMETIEQRVKRIEECEALGLWNFGAYVISPDIRLVNEVCHTYLSLTQGSNSHFERPSINVWSANAQRGAHREDINAIRKYLTYLKHPVFMKERSSDRLFNSENWPRETSCTAEISGSELTRAMNLPLHSVPGLPVIECAAFGRGVSSYDPIAQGDVRMGKIHHMHHDEEADVKLSQSSLASHVFVTGSTGSGKSNTVCTLLEQAECDYLVIEPAKGEYKSAMGSAEHYFGTNFMMGEILKINPFVFPDGIHVYEHIDRILEVFNVCWPMYAAMPAVLKEAVIRAYEKVGWDLKGSRNRLGRFYPTFADVCDQIDAVILSSDYSDENKGNYRGSLKTRLESLTNGINELVFCSGSIPDEDLFDSKTIVDLSRGGSSENKSLIMGILVIRLQEHRIAQSEGAVNRPLRHITVLEEAHNILRSNAVSGQAEIGGGIASKSVEMIANAIAEMRTYGEGFVIVDQAPGLVDASAIRNTNTKIIMRLPDQSDRELVGRAANLDDSQIAELSRLQRGIAAIYQNEWIEPVLCHVSRHEDEPMADRGLEADLPNSGLSNTERKYVNSCIYDPLYLARPSELNFVDCVSKLDCADSTKAMMVEYARTPRSKRRELYSEICFAHFGIRNVVESVRSNEDGDGWREELRRYLVQSFSFNDDVDFTRGSAYWHAFETAMLAEAVSIIRLESADPETVEHFWNNAKIGRWE